MTVDAGNIPGSRRHAALASAHYDNAADGLRAIPSGRETALLR
jgi:hypothetical protein